MNVLVPTYDADGNMLTWNGWTYTWNGENRLVCAESGDTKVEMNYDYTGRRFEKKVYTKGLLNFYTWTLQKHEKYVYDGYKQIASYDALNSEALLKTYTWQPVDLDVPVSMTSGGETYYYVTDGNKNVTALLDASDNRVAEYTYGPFGQTLEADGSIAEENPFRFSSEFHDTELGLVYYNYRHYNPTLGRWIKRDPIEENSGMNLYGLALNAPISLIDFLGLATLDEIEEMYRKMIEDARQKGKNVAADNLEHYLGATGKTRVLDWAWLRGFSSVLSAEKVNRKRFEEEIKEKAKLLNDGEVYYLYDYWDSQNTANKFSELFYASGTFTITSYGAIILERKGNCIKVDGMVDHYWWDPYDFHVGLGAFIPGTGYVSDSDAVRLVKAKRAKNFFMESEWNQSITGAYILKQLWFNHLNITWGEANAGSSNARAIVIRKIGEKAIRPSSH